jgi:glycosyltransferase involved in cell wall biosynthesis
MGYSLFLTRWYPHRYDAMEGLFVRKHAESIGRFMPIKVLYICQRPEVKRRELHVCEWNESVREMIVYAKDSRFRFLKIMYYFIAFFSGLRFVFRHYGRPEITHCHIFSRDIFVAYWMKKWWKIPYVVTEHWSTYLPENGTFQKSSKLNRWSVKFLAKHADKVMPVSEHLIKSMMSHGIRADYQKVNNVVDDFFFQAQKKRESEKVRILHVSCFFDEAKNISGILRVAAQLREKRDDFELVMVGTGVDFEQMVDYASNLSLGEDLVVFLGELSPHEVCEEMTKADILLLFSNYETFSVVVAESLSSGVPVVSSAVCEIPKMVTEECGILVSPKDEKALLEKLDYMIDHFSEFDTEKIKTIAKQYSYDFVGKEVVSIYEKALSKKILSK